VKKRKPRSTFSLVRIGRLGGLSLIPALLLVLGAFQGPVLAAAETDQEKIDELRGQIDEMWDVIDEMEDRLVEEEKKSAWDRLNLYGDFRVRYAYEKWNLPAQSNFPTFIDMMQFGTPGEAIDTIVSVIDFLANDQLPLQKRDPFTLTNSENWDMRFRLKMKANISKNIKFQAWLTVKRNFGSGIVDPIFNGSPNTVYNSFNASSINSDVTVKLSRAYGVWTPDFFPLILTVGRQAATDGPPREIREDRVRQGTPPALLIDAEIDGIMLGLQVNKLVKSLPPTVVRVCYGIGYEAGFGGGGRVEKSTANMGMFRWVSVAGLRDMKVLGGCADTQLPFLSEKTLLSLAYFRGMDLTDIPSGLTVNFPDPWNSNAQRVTATANLGDVDLFGFVLESQNFGVDWFVTAGCNIFHPNGNLSQYGFGSLGNNDPRYAEQLGSSPAASPTTSHAGFSVFTGFKVPIPILHSKVGFEYNYGSQYWFSFTQASDDINNKLATRGHVFEPYWILNIYKDNLLARMGYQYYLYEYSLSGWHIGEPVPVEDGGTYFYPTPREVHNLYAMLEFRF
jgi:hypothetical protein